MFPLFSFLASEARLLVTRHPPILRFYVRISFPLPFETEILSRPISDNDEGKKKGGRVGRHGLSVMTNQFRVKKKTLK